MASLLFRSVDFSARHPSDFDLDSDSFHAGVSPTSTPRSMYPRNTSNPFGSPPTPPPLSLGDLAVRFSEQSLESVNEDEEEFAALKHGVTSQPSFQHSLPTPPSEDECLPDCFPTTLPPVQPHPSPLQHLQQARRAHPHSTTTTGEPFHSVRLNQPKPAPPGTRHNYSLSVPVIPTLALDVNEHDLRATDYEDLFSPSSPTAASMEARLGRRRKSTPAMRQAYWNEAVMEALEARLAASGAATAMGLGRGCRGRRWGDEHRRREECGISKAGRFRRGGMGRRGAVSY